MHLLACKEERSRAGEERCRVGNNSGISTQFLTLALDAHRRPGDSPLMIGGPAVAMHILQAPLPPSFSPLLVMFLTAREIAL